MNNNKGVLFIKKKKGKIFSNRVSGTKNKNLTIMIKKIEIQNAIL